MMIYREVNDGYYTDSIRVLATPEEEVEYIRELADAIVDWLYSDGAKSGKEIRDLFGVRSKALVDKILFAHPSIAKIGNTKSRKYYYTEDTEEALPWLFG